MDFEEKPFKFFGHVEYWLGQILGGTLQLKFEGWRCME
jgi:hypothetical protein